MKNWIRIFFWLPALALLGLAGCGSPGASAGEGLTVRDAWARPGASGGNGAAYFTIENGTEADTLLSASAEVAQAVELHRSLMKDDGTMSMEQQQSVPVPQNETVSFEPGGLHVMLINLPEGLSAGDTFPLTLTFEKAGEITVEVTVREP